MTDREKAAEHLHDAADSLEAAIRCALGAAVSAPIETNLLTENRLRLPGEDIELTTSQYTRLTEQLTATRDEIRTTATGLGGVRVAPEQ